MDEYDDCLSEIKESLPITTDTTLHKLISDILVQCYLEQASARSTAQAQRDAEQRKQAQEKERQQRRERGFDVAAAARRGAEAYKNGKFAEALDIITDALEFDCPKNVKVALLSNRAHAYFKVRYRFLFSLLDLGLTPNQLPSDDDEDYLEKALTDCESVAEILGSVPHFKTFVSSPSIHLFNLMPLFLHRILLRGSIYLRQRNLDGAISQGKRSISCASGRDQKDKAIEFLDSAMAARLNARRDEESQKRREEEKSRPTPEELKVLNMLAEMDLKSPHEVRGPHIHIHCCSFGCVSDQVMPFCM